MGIQIIDGKGSGNVAEVKNNKLLVSAIVSSQEHYANHNNGKGYSVVFETTPTSGDCFFYLKNTDDISLSIEGFSIYMEADDYIDIYLKNTGTPSDTTTVTPNPLNTGSGNVAKCDVYYGTNITGLTAGNHVLRLYKENNKKSEYFNFDMDIILGDNGVFTMWTGTNPSKISITINFNFHGANN